MNNPKKPLLLAPLSLSDETSQSAEKAVRAAARQNDPTHRYHPATGNHDSRTDAAAGLSLQHLRARQSKKF
jgi:hypothetical protein